MASIVGMESKAISYLARTYTLEGGVTIKDKTNGSANVVFSGYSEKSQRPLYTPSFNGRKFTHVTDSSPGTAQGLRFAGSKKISFKYEGELIRLKEVDETDTTIFYFEPKNVVEGVAHDLYSYIPTEITLEEAKKKIAHLKEECSTFEPFQAVYNRHGVAVFGLDNNEKSYVFYWANPQEEKVKKMKCSECDQRRDGGSLLAKSKDQKVNFRYLIKGLRFDGAYLNAEKAAVI